MYDEGPSQDDVDRFSSHNTGYCPHCGEEIWDDATKCTKCGTWLQEGVVHQDLEVRSFKKKFLVLVVVALLICFFWGISALLQ